MNETDQRIADALARIATVTRHQEQLQAQTDGLSPLQARVLQLLERRKELRVGDLAEQLMVTYGTASAAITSLEGKGLLIKAADPEEHRVVNVRLTRQGVRAARNTRGWQTELLSPALADLDGGDSATLLALLLQLIRSLERQGKVSTTRMCMSCRYFDPNGGEGAQPHFCRLLQQPIGNADLQVDCPDHQLADSPRQDTLWREFRPTP